MRFLKFAVSPSSFPGAVEQKHVGEENHQDDKKHTGITPGEREGLKGELHRPLGS